ncbi:FAD-dependent oxidoreductase [Terracoccus luteus]|uniref:Assimilatory nitrate reductase electron transfer subunit n=1 Tax=Terracoccus luteus TaxID=53356 RepID=A0A839PMY6_9MICO|nr:FAD-dependent oxidoreductase [Terracoccus luteus]MBB2985658.1 assimilatory nitrate reductase electron transfer subunit [Terracoccus luteus]MCP2171310.1 assimilatory nitrate reductase electron transfer subunit [Terracoccus luteus]
MTTTTRRVLVVGNGMAGARLAEELRRRDPDAERLTVTVVGEEPHAAYNRVLLSTVVAGGITTRDTRLKPEGWWESRRVDVVRGSVVTAVDVTARTATLTTAGGERVERWDELVLATGSVPFVPPIEGVDAGRLASGRQPGVVAFRTVDDCDRITVATESASHAVVLGGGLLGLEAARGLLARGVEVTVVHPQAHPMDRQLDADGGAVLTRVLSGLGARLVLGRRVVAHRPASDDRPPTVALDDGSELRADLLVVAAGVRPRTELARAAGLVVRRGVVVDDHLATSAAHVHALGECAEHRGEVPGLVQPGWDQARVLADRLSGADAGARYEGTPTLTRLKARDIDLASMGRVDVDVHDAGHEVLAFTDPVRGRYAKLVLRHDRLVGAILLGVGDAAGPLTQLYDTAAVVPRDRLALMLGRAVTRGSAPEQVNLAEMPGGAVVCRCNTVTKAAVVAAHRDGADTVAAVAERTRATTGCGSCRGAVEGLCAWLRSAEPDRGAGEPVQQPERPAAHHLDQRPTDDTTAPTEGAA